MEYKVRNAHHPPAGNCIPTLPPSIRQPKHPTLTSLHPMPTSLHPRTRSNSLANIAPSQAPLEPQPDHPRSPPGQQPGSVTDTGRARLGSARSGVPNLLMEDRRCEVAAGERGAEGRRWC
jgi:hypothetical protein